MSNWKRVCCTMFAVCVLAVGSASAVAAEPTGVAAATATLESVTGVETNDGCSPLQTAACGKCGDGYCNPRCGETAESCPRDCGVETELLARACGKCGDGYCNPRCGETAESCPRDCGVELERAALTAPLDTSFEATP